MAFSTIIAIAGIGLQMVGAAQQAKAQKMQLEAQADQQRSQAKIAAKQEHTQKVNAEISRLNAGEVRRAGEIAVHDRGLRTKQTLGAARAAIAQNGLIVDQPGTTGEAVFNDLVRAGALDVTRIYQRSRGEQLRALQQAQNFTMQADIFDTQEKALYDVAKHTDKQAGMISPGLAALTAGIGGLGNLLT